MSFWMIAIMSSTWYTMLMLDADKDFDPSLKQKKKKDFDPSVFFLNLIDHSGLTQKKDLLI